MIVPLTLGDFLERAELVYGHREAVVDEPNPPGGGLGRVTYSQLADMARSLAAALDDLGVGENERVAIVSPNAARFLVAMFGVSVFGRILVPGNFRLNAEEIRYIVEHSGSSVLLVDPELDESLRDIKVKHRFVLGTATDAQLFLRQGVKPKLSVADENATVSINYTSGTTARPKGVQLTHRNFWLNAVTFGWHLAMTDRDVYLHTLPMFHCNGWGMPYALTAMGVRHVIIRKIDGEEILRRVEQEGVTLFNCAPAVIAAVLDAASARRGKGAAVPGKGRVRVVIAGAPPPSKTIERIETELGWEFIQIYGLTETSPLLTFNRAPAEWDGFDPVERARHLSAPAFPRSASACGSTTRVRCWPARTTSSRAIGASPRRRTRRSSTAGFTPGTAATARARTSPSATGRRTSSSRAARTSRRSRSRTACSSIPRWRRWRSSACPTRSGARPSKRWSWCARA